MIVTKENINEMKGQMLYHVNPYGINDPENLSISKYDVTLVTSDEVYYTCCYKDYFGMSKYLDTRSYIGDIIRNYKRTFTMYSEAKDYIELLKKEGIPDEVLAHNLMCEIMFSKVIL